MSSITGHLPFPATRRTQARLLPATRPRRTVWQMPDVSHVDSTPAARTKERSLEPCHTWTPQFSPARPVSSAGSARPASPRTPAMCRSLRDLRERFGHTESSGPALQVGTIHRIVQQRADIAALQFGAGVLRPDELGKDQIFPAYDPGLHTVQLDWLAACKLHLPIFRTFAHDQIDLDAGGKMHEVEQTLRDNSSSDAIGVDVEIRRKYGDKAAHVFLIQ